LRPLIFRVIKAAIAGHHMIAPTYILEGYRFTMAYWKGEVRATTSARNRKIVFQASFLPDIFFSIYFSLISRRKTK
jgi:hypothetical protein